MAIINNDFHDVLTGRHSVRRFDPSVKISREEMTEMLKETIRHHLHATYRLGDLWLLIQIKEEKNCINIL